MNLNDFTSVVGHDPYENAPKEIYVVMRKGVYQQGIVGVSYKSDKAFEMARDAFNKEKDTYHVFYVHKLLVDQNNIETLLDHEEKPEFVVAGRPVSSYTTYVLEKLR